MALFILPPRATNANGATLSGAKLYFYETQGLVPADVFTTADLDVAHSFPVEADAGGLFAPIYLDPAVTYRAILKTSAGVSLQDIDPYNNADGSVGNVTLDQFGGVADANASGAGTDNTPAWLLCKAYLQSVADALDGNEYYKSIPAVRLNRGGYYFSDAIDLTDGIYQFIGYGPGVSTGGGNTTFWFASGKNGFIFQSWDTLGVSGSTANTPKGSAGTLVQDITCISKGGTVGAAQHGFLIKAPVTLTRCTAYNFGGNGFYVAADVIYAGNANCWKMHDCWGIYNGGSGFFADGGDSNAGNNIGFNAIANREWGINDSSFLGNNHIGYHTSGNGIAGAGPGWTVTASAGSSVHYLGDLYRVIPGQHVGASTNAPTGLATSNTWWKWISTGTATTLYPTWSSGAVYVSGGAVYSDDANSKSLFGPGYMEGDQMPGWLDSTRSLAMGGFQGFSKGAHLNAHDGYVIANAFRTGVAFGAGALYSFVGTVDDTSGDLLQFGHSTILADNYRLTMDSVGDLIFTYQNATHTIYRLTGPGTTQQFGRGVAQPYKFCPTEIMLNGISLTFGAAAPTTDPHALGEYVFNNLGTTTKERGWRCVTAGTPGTWEADYRELYGSVTYDAPSVAASGTTTTTITVTGAALGDIATCSFGVSLVGLVASAYVSTSNTVTVVLFNPTVGAIDLASTTIRAKVTRQ